MIDINLIDSFLVAATKDVFSTMLGWEVNGADTMEGDGTPRRLVLGDINGSIGFGGKMTGNLFLSCTKPVAGDMAVAILGDEEHSSKEVSDVVGELTNMLAGGCKTRMNDKGLDVVMSIPNIITGKGIRAGSKDVRFMISRDFAIAGGDRTVQVCVLGKFE